MLDFYTKQHMYTYMQTQRQCRRAINTMLKWIDCSVFEYHRFIEARGGKDLLGQGISFSVKRDCCLLHVLQHSATIPHCISLPGIFQEVD